MQAKIWICHYQTQVKRIFFKYPRGSDNKLALTLAEDGLRWWTLAVIHSYSFRKSKRNQVNMSLASFIPANTQKARATAISAFNRMLEAENVSMDVVQSCILSDNASKCVTALMDRFGYYLATNEGKKGKLSRNSAISYFRNVKLWLFEEHPHIRQPSEADLLKKGKTLEKHCMKREKGGFINKAPPCTKADLRSLTRHLYSTAAVASDYEDAALACLMWHCFGRSSDLAFMRKQYVTMSADDVFYIRMLRVKTSEEQGLTLVPDRDDFLTCPFFTLAVALMMQEAPCESLLSQLPALSSPAAVELLAGVPLLDLLQSASSPGPGEAPAPTITPAPTPQPTPRTQSRGEDGVQAYVNRLLKRVADAAGATSNLASHSFRRGGAQHANGDERLAAQWIFDRGSWDMSKTNKGFAYVFNTPREDRKVARVWSGWKPDQVPKIADVAALDHGAQERLARLQALLFSSCTGLKDDALIVSRKVLGVMTAYLIKYLPLMKDLAPSSMFVARMEEGLCAAKISTADVLAWSVALNAISSKPVETEEQETKTKCCGADCHHAAVLKEVIESNRQMAARLLLLENVVLKQRKRSAEEEDQSQPTSVQEPQPKRRKKAATNLSSTWYEWYTRTPRIWSSAARQKKSESRHVVAFMKLFRDGGFDLDDASADYKDRALDLGTRAEASLLKFLAARGIKAKGSGSVLRSLRPLHKRGVLDERITAYKHLLAIGTIRDPAPEDTQDILAVVGHV